MGEITTGLRAILSHPRVYDAFQNLMGAPTGRRDFVENFVRPAPGDRILDLGCGTAQILGYLPDNLDYWGYDINPAYIAHAEKTFGRRGRFTCGELDRPELAQLPPFDIVLACGLLHHLDDDTALSFLLLARDALGTGGRLVSIDPCFADGQSLVSRFLVSRDRGQHVRWADGYRHLAHQVFPVVTGTVRHRAWIPYTHWIMECAL